MSFQDLEAEFDKLAKAVLAVRDERNNLLQQMRAIKLHLDAIAESACSMGYTDIEHLGEAQEIVDAALKCQHAYHQVFDAACRTFRVCQRCGHTPDNLASR